MNTIKDQSDSDKPLKAIPLDYLPVELDTPTPPEVKSKIIFVSALLVFGVIILMLVFAMAADFFHHLHYQ